MFYRPNRSVRLTLTAAKAAVLASIVVAGLLGSGAGSPVGQQSRYVVDEPSPVERLLARHDCSPSGFGSSAQPLSAIVRSPTGKPRYGDFETGWAIYTRHGAATLVAVCL